MGTQENVPKSYPSGYNDAHHPKGNRHPCFSFIPATLPIALTRMSSSTGAAGARNGLTATSTGRGSDNPPRLGAGNRLNGKARLLEEASDPAKPPQPTINNHRRCRYVFMADEQGRSLSKEPLTSRRHFLKSSFFPWAKHRGLNRSRDLTSAELVNFRATWKNNGLTANRKLSRLVGFFCVLYSKWVAPREPRDESEALGTDFTSDRLVFRRPNSSESLTRPMRMVSGAEAAIFISARIVLAL